MSLFMSEPTVDTAAPALADARLAALRAGDTTALEEVLHELLPDVRRWLLRLLGPRADVDDAAQDALIELAKALPSFEGRARLRTFAHRVTVRVAFRYYKRRARWGDVHEAVDIVDGDDPEARMMQRQALARLHEVLAALPEKRRVAFVLCSLDGLTPSEAANVAGSTALAMRSRLHYARAAVEYELRNDPALAAWVSRGGRTR